MKASIPKVRLYDVMMNFTRTYRQQIAFDKGQDHNKARECSVQLASAVSVTKETKSGSTPDSTSMDSLHCASNLNIQDYYNGRRFSDGRHYSW